MINEPSTLRRRSRRPRLLAAACLAALPLAVYGQDSPAALAPAPTDARPQVCGRLESVAGVSVLYLWGSERERGFAEGYLLADELELLVEGFCLDPAVMPSPLAWQFVVLPRVLKRMEITTRLRERCEGLLAGLTARKGSPLQPEKLGRPFGVDDLIALSALPDLAGLMCSSFAAWDESVADRAPIVGRNLDYRMTPAVCETVMLKVHALSEGRRAWIEIGWPGPLGCLTGYSEDGVYMAIHDVRPMGQDVDGLFTPRAHAFQEILESLAPGDDLPQRAAELLRSKRFVMGGNGMLAWNESTDGAPSRGAAVLEIDDRFEITEGVSVRLPEETQPFLACSNHHRLRALDRRCRRYHAIWEGLDTSSETALDRETAWKVISAASVKRTLYRLVLDLGREELELDRRNSMDRDDWAQRARIDLRQLFDNLEAYRAKKAEPATPAGGR